MTPNNTRVFRYVQVIITLQYLFCTLATTLPRAECNWLLLFQPNSEDNIPTSLVIKPVKSINRCRNRHVNGLEVICKNCWNASLYISMNGKLRHCNSLPHQRLYGQSRQFAFPLPHRKGTVPPLFCYLKKICLLRIFLKEQKRN